jgi:hypothetical protein
MSALCVHLKKENKSAKQKEPDKPTPDVQIFANDSPFRVFMQR